MQAFKPWRRGRTAAVCLAAAAAVTLAAAGAAAQSLDPQTWTWPAAAQDPALRRSIIEGGYTQQELRNIYTQLVALSPMPGAPERGPAGAASRPAEGAASQNAGWAQIAAPNVRPGRAFRGLDALYAGPGFTGGPAGSMADRRNVVETVLAKGDRVIVMFHIEGHHTGSFYGFPASGKPLKVRQFAVARYSADGRIIEADFYGDDFALYTQLGGRVELAKETK